MSETIHNAIKLAADPYAGSAQQRANAVAAALEVISKRAPITDNTSLKAEFEQLAHYANQIQAALKLK
ncbi:hypothetical protein [Pseudomonas serboccidentalis]|uniref:hypothetical protein n=1 Tax=Pseudomonas serboccidentalis TaxID=2964670 RepID=UPI0039E1A034